ncbi:class I adenylate-forming enzyme family protein [Mumia sp. Pv 4-285]|uniref:class I adenylate-forming enzyme family protein n=1 Tax=Mumia qirimensis TaxID=3234852 RepID=UPI00351D9AAD
MTGTMQSERRRVGPLSQWDADESPDLLEESIGEILLRRAAEQGERPAVHWLVDGQVRSLSYADLAAQATRAAHAIAGCVDKGERMAIWSRNELSWIVLEYAAALAGVILTPFNTAWSDGEVRHAIALTTPTLVFAGTDARGDDLSERVKPLAGGIDVVAMGELDEWVAGQPEHPLPEVSAEDPFLIQFTSGTTGRAKGAVLSQRSALNCAYQRNRAEVIVDDDCYCNPVPYHHVGGSCSVILGGVSDGGAIVLLQRWIPEDVVRLLESGVATRVGGVPTMMIDLVARLKEGGGQQYGLASVSVGGAQVPEYLIEEVAQLFGAPVVNTYAQSESPMITTTSSTDEASIISTTVGRPAGGVSLRIVAPDSGEVVPVGEPGEIVVKSPYVMMGYWDMPEQTAAASTADGYLKTGDLASMDEFGNISFRGRARDVIIRGGENIYPAEVEEIVAQHPDVAGVVVVGAPDERYGERPVGVVVRRPGSSVTGEALSEYLAGELARFKIPTSWRFVDEFPMTASGKVRRFLLREAAAEE